MKKKRKSLGKSLGSVVAYLGPMFAEKTGRALLAARKEAVRRRRDGGMQQVCYLKPVRDDRSAGILSRMGMEEVLCQPLPLDPDEALEMLRRSLDDLSNAIIVMDEFQFFPLPKKGSAKRAHEILEMLLMAAAKGKKVFLAGLDADYLRRPFPMTRVLLLDPRVRKRFLVAFCDVCNGPATLSQRLLHGRPAPRDMPREIVEGEADGVAYEPRCFRCHVIPS